LEVIVKLDKGATYCLADQIRAAAWNDLKGRQGFDAAFGDVDRCVMEEMVTEQTKVIAEVIERFLADTPKR
jgi:hypothetical protein